MPIRIPCSIFHQQGRRDCKMALEWHFGRIQWQLFRRKSLQFPCIFRCCREFARERFARDWILRHTVWDAEKFGCIAPKIARNRRNSASFAVKPDWRNCPTEPPGKLSRPFLCSSRCPKRESADDHA